MIPAELHFGNENQMGAEWKVQVFGMDPVKGAEVHVTQLPMEMLRQHNKNTSTARTGISWDIGGGWTSMNTEIQPGAIVKLFVSRKRLRGIPMKAAALFRAREDAPVISVMCEGLSMNDSSLPNCLPIIGRFDKVTLAEARAVGYIIPSTYDKFFSSIDEDDLMTITEIEAGIPAPRVTVESVETVDGKVKQIVKPLELRRVRKRPKTK